MTDTYVRRYFDPDKDPAPDRTGRYVYAPDIVLAVNVALATGRPLLVLGPPGCGKSSLAKDVAHILRRSYHELVVTSRTRAQDLMWQFDAIRRLSDAQVRTAGADAPAVENYVEPGVLWWAFDRASAERQATLSGAPRHIVVAGTISDQWVILLDEIDKAEPDVPNDLLVPLGEFRFMVHESRRVVGCDPEKPPLIVITSNEERELPPAFLRRCIQLRLDAPDRDRRAQIARVHFPPPTKKGGVTDELIAEVSGQFENLAQRAAARSLRKPGTAEFIDALRACEALGVSNLKSQWFAMVTESTMFKHPSGSGDGDA